MQDENTHIKKVRNAQVKSPSKGDWASEVYKILKELKIEKNLWRNNSYPNNWTKKNSNAFYSKECVHLFKFN